MHVPVMERRTSAAEYFQRDEADDFKLELINGRIVPMAGSTMLHNRVTGNIFIAVRAELEPIGCEAFMASQDEPRIECAQRDGSAWIESEHVGLDDRLVINAPACEIPLREIYRHLL